MLIHSPHQLNIQGYEVYKTSYIWQDSIMLMLLASSTSRWGLNSLSCHLMNDSKIKFQKEGDSVACTQVIN